MPVVKKHPEAVAMDGIHGTPVRRSTRQKRGPTPQLGAPRWTSLQSARGDAHGPPQTPVPSPPDDLDLSPEPSTAAMGNTRKRKSLGTSTVKTLANCRLGSHKKRARTSIGGTPGKANPMDLTRERDVAKRFVELDVTEVYRAIRKQTGALGGNAAGGAIYGEITQNSFQRVVDYMKEHCGLCEASLFLDVGSGLGKPNLHVAIDPGVEVSFGIELEELRWQLSLHNLKSVLQLDAIKTRTSRTMFTAGDVTHAKSFNPFSHIYSFDVGFPPDVMEHMANIFNVSRARYFASFHRPRKMIECYGFDVENIGRVATTMAGSSEGHTCYFYRKLTMANSIDEKENAQCNRASRDGSPEQEDADAEDLLHIDPLFRQGFDILSRGKDAALAWINSYFGEQHQSGRTRRQRRSLQVDVSQRRQERPLESYYRVVKHPVTTK